jgi:hypothetical protein
MFHIERPQTARRPGIFWNIHPAPKLVFQVAIKRQGRTDMVKVLAAAIMALSLVGGAMAQSSGTGSAGGNGSSSAGGAPHGGGGGTNSMGGNAASGAGGLSDPGGSVDKCKTGATGKTTTKDASVTKQEAKNCP